MDSIFNITDYLSGLTTYVFEKSVLERVARDRGVFGVTAYENLSEKDKALLKADLLYEIYIGANSSASYSVSDGAFKESVGSQTINDKKYLYGVIYTIYKQYDDGKMALLGYEGNEMTWINETD